MDGPFLPIIMGSRPLARYWTTWLVAAVVAGTAVVAAVAIAPGSLTIRLPTSLEESSVGGTTASLGALGVELSRGSLAFGPLTPGEASDPVDVRVTNTGAAPLRFRVSATPLENADADALIRPDRIAFAVGEDATGMTLGQVRDVAGVTVAPGGGVTFTFTLHAPSGAEQWLPAGEYAGDVTLVAEEGAS